MAAGTSSRFVPLSYETPKSLLEVKGEILIERQIRQLKEAGVEDITVVVGYKAEKFRYLKDKFNVSLVFNEDFFRYNNTSSIIRVLHKLSDTYICSSDNYFPENVFLGEPSQSFYSALMAEGETSEYCLSLDEEDNIVDVKVGGRDCWYMIGHVFFSHEFSRAFKAIMREEYLNEETRQGYWEDVYIKHLSELPLMKVRKYSNKQIHEFDTLDELRIFDSSYISDSRSTVLKRIASEMNCEESCLSSFKNLQNLDNNLLFSFKKGGEDFIYDGRFDRISTL